MTSGSDDIAAPRRRFAAMSKRQAVVPVPFPPGHILVPRWRQSREASGWRLVGADLSLPGGIPYGSLWYRNATNRQIRIGVRWDAEREVPQCTYLHPTKGLPATDRDAFDVAAVELDAQARITALQAINAFLFAQIATRDTEDAILDAAGLGLVRIDDDPAPA